jgi:tRNA(fMet)-specific endonuclease VapC
MEDRNQPPDVDTRVPLCDALATGHVYLHRSGSRPCAPRTKLDRIGISAVTLAELRYGVSKSRDPARNAAALTGFCAALTIHPFEQSAALRYGEIRTELERAETPIGPLDLLIAAHALALGTTLVSSNEREFRRVSGLRVESWS